MSKANNPIKVLKTAYKRIARAWSKSSWVMHNENDGTYEVCLEGAIYGYCQPGQHKKPTKAQERAVEVVKQIIFERFKERGINYRVTDEGDISIPAFNDSGETTKDEVLEVVKLGIIRLEAEKAEAEMEEELTEEVDELFDRPATKAS